MSRLMHLPVTATTTLMATTMNLLTNAFERLGRFDNDEGTTTIEYAMAALAAAALAGVTMPSRALLRTPSPTPPNRHVGER